MKNKSKTGTEVHHKKFRSQGGPDSPENLVVLSEYEHAELHAWEFINGGPWFDYRMTGAKLLPLEVQYLVVEEMSRRTVSRNHEMVANGTHPSFSDRHRTQASERQRERFKELNGVDKEWEEKRLLSLRETHNRLRSCPHCGTTGRGTVMTKWHFDNCPTITGEIRTQRKLTCPHCGLTGGTTNMKRYHFDNCKHK